MQNTVEPRYRNEEILLVKNHKTSRGNKQRMIEQDVLDMYIS